MQHKTWAFWIMVLFLGMQSGPVTSAEGEDRPVQLYAAGSLGQALAEVARDFEMETGIPVRTTFAPSGLLRNRIADGEPAQVFASANMEHPRALARDGIGGPVALFARNRLCALARPGLDVSTASLLQVMLAPDVRLGTSTPEADPSGDYAWELFRRADSVKPGSFETLSGKALTLTGGPESEPAPEGRNQYAWVMTENRADLFLTYCTNAVLARRDTGALRIVPVPDELAVGADYGLSILTPDHPAATRLALYILSPPGQRILADYGFDAPGVTDD